MNLNPEQLNGLRLKGDPLADETIARLFKDNKKELLNDFLTQLNQNEDISKISTDPIIQNYIEKSSQLPFEIDWNKVSKCEEFFGIYGPEVSMFLLLKSLPETYSCKKGVQVLYATRRFMKNRDGSLDNFTRRLMETSQFVVNVLEKDGLRASGKGIVSAQKVRLMHAAIRYYILNGPIPGSDAWNTEDLGIPINQEDMIGTLCSFSSLILEGFDNNKIDIDDEYRDAFMYVWSIIGHLMGVIPEYIPLKHSEGLKIGHAILDHQMGACPEGKELNDACIYFLHHIVPGNQFDHVPSLLMRHFVGEQISEVLGIENEDVSILEKLTSNAIIKELTSIDDFKNNHESRHLLLRSFNRSMLQGMVGHINDNKKVLFRVPPDLQENWEINSPWQTVWTTPSLFNRRLKLEKKQN